MDIATSWSTATETRTAFGEAMGALIRRIGDCSGYMMMYSAEKYLVEELLAAPAEEIHGRDS